MSIKIMDRKGFTLVEVLSVLVIIGIISAIAIRQFSSTVSLSRDEGYKVMKSNIISASYDYISECKAKTIECDYHGEEIYQFSVKKLKETGFFQNFISPIDGKNLENCLFVEVKQNNGVIISSLLDHCY